MDLDNCKQFFDSYAEEHNFSPKVASNWYSVDFDDIVEQVRIIISLALSLSPRLSPSLHILIVSLSLPKGEEKKGEGEGGRT